jgi:hypothetical protein
VTLALLVPLLLYPSLLVDAWRVRAISTRVSKALQCALCVQPTQERVCWLALCRHQHVCVMLGLPAPSQAPPMSALHVLQDDIRVSQARPHVQRVLLTQALRPMALLQSQLVSVLWATQAPLQVPPTSALHVLLVCTTMPQAHPHVQRVLLAQALRPMALSQSQLVSVLWATQVPSQAPPMSALHVLLVCTRIPQELQHVCSAALGLSRTQSISQERHHAVHVLLDVTAVHLAMVCALLVLLTQALVC